MNIVSGLFSRRGLNPGGLWFQSQALREVVGLILISAAVAFCFRGLYYLRDFSMGPEQEHHLSAENIDAMDSGVE